MRIIAAVTSTYKYEHKSKCILDTWSKGIDTVFITDRNSDNIKFVKVTDQSDYESGVIKNIETIKYFYSIIDKYDFFLICDDDTYIFKNNLIKLLEKYNNRNDSFGIGWLQSSFTSDHGLLYFSGGAGYVLSKQAIIDSYNWIMTKGYKSYKWGDVTLGYVFDSVKLEKIHNFYFNPQNSESVNENDINKYISFHYVKGDEYYKLYDIDKNE